MFRMRRRKTLFHRHTRTRSRNRWRERRWPEAPQDRVPLSEVKESHPSKALNQMFRILQLRELVGGKDFSFGHGDVVIAAITSCTLNTSNPSVMLAAGLLGSQSNCAGAEDQAMGQDLAVSRLPGGRGISGRVAGLQELLDALGFNLVGFGCATCMGNSGPLAPDRSPRYQRNDLVFARYCRATATSRAASTRMCERTISRRRHWWSPMRSRARSWSTWQETRSARTKTEDRCTCAIFGRATEEIQASAGTVTGDLFKCRYADVFAGDANRKDGRNPRHGPSEGTRPRPTSRTLLRGHREGAEADHGHRRCAYSASSWPLDDDQSRPPAHQGGISRREVPQEHQVPVADFNQYGTRRGNHEIMMRGTFANIRIKNQMVKDERRRGRGRITPSITRGEGHHLRRRHA